MQPPHSFAAMWVSTVGPADMHHTETRPCVMCGDSRERTVRRTIFAHAVSQWLASNLVFSQSPANTLCRNLCQATVRMQPDVELGHETIALCTHCKSFVDAKRPNANWHPLAELTWFLQTLELIQRPPPSHSYHQHKVFDRRLIKRLATILCLPSNMYQQCFSPVALECCHVLARSDAPTGVAAIAACYKTLNANSLFTHAQASEYIRGLCPSPPCGHAHFFSSTFPANT